MKTVSQAVTTHLDVMTAEIKENLIKNEENSDIYSIKQQDDINRNQSDNNNQTAITFEDYRNHNISRALNDNTNDNTNDKCCSCDWNYCLSETW